MRIFFLFLLIFFFGINSSLSQSDEQKLSDFFSFQKNGEFENALVYEDFIYDFAIKTFGKDTNFINYTFILGYMNNQVGRNQKALLYFNEIIPISQTIRGINSLNHANLLYHTASCYKNLTQNNESLSYYKKAEQIYVSNNETNNLIFLDILEEIAFNHFVLKELIQSKNYYLKAISLMKTSKRENSNSYLSCIDLLGRVMFELKEYENSIPNIEFTILEYSKNLIYNIDSYRINLLNLSKANFELGKYKVSESFYLKYLDECLTIPDLMDKSAYYQTITDLIYIYMITNERDKVFNFKELELTFWLSNVDAKKEIVKNDEIYFYENSKLQIPRCYFSLSLDSPTKEGSIKIINEGIKWIEQNKVESDTNYYYLNDRKFNLLFELQKYDEASIQLTILDKIINKYFSNNIYFEINQNFKRSNIFQNNGDFDNSFKLNNEIYSKVKNNLGLLNNNEIYFEYTEVIGNISNYYFERKEVDSAIYYCEIGIELFDFIYANNPLNQFDSVELISRYISELSILMNFYSMDIKKFQNQYAEALFKLNAISELPNVSFEDQLEILRTKFTNEITNEESNYANITLNKINELLVSKSASELEMLRYYYISKAQILNKFGQINQAVELLDYCLKNIQNIPRDNLICIINNQSTYLAEINRFDESLSLRKWHLEFFSDENKQEMDPTYRSDYLLSLGNMGELYFLKNDFKSTISISEKHFEIVKRFYKPETEIYLNSLHNFASTLANTDNIERAERLLLESLELHKKYYGLETKSYEISLTNLFIFYHSNNLFEKGDKYFYENFNLIKSNFILQTVGLSDSEFSYYSLNLLKAYSTFFDYSIKRKDSKPEMLEFMINQYLIVNNLKANRYNYVLSISEGSKIKIQYLEQKKKLINYLEYSDLMLNKEAINIEEEKTLFKLLENNLFLEYPYKYDETMNIDKVSQSLKNDEQFIFPISHFTSFHQKYKIQEDTIIIIPQKKYYIFCNITNNLKNNLTYTISKEGETIDESIESISMDFAKFNGDKTNQLNDKNPDKYFSSLTEPLIEIISDHKRIIFSPSELFNDINIESLINIKTSHYLLDDYIITYSDALSLIYKNERNISETNQNVVLFGNPDFNVKLQNDHMSERTGMTGITYDGAKWYLEKRLFVKDIVLNFAADKSKIKVGYEILKIDNVLLDPNWTIENIIKLTKGKIGTSILFNLKRNDGEIQDFEVNREDPKLLIKTSYKLLPGTQKEVETISNMFILAGYKSFLFQNESANEDNLKKIESPKILHIATHSFFTDYAKINNNSLSTLNGIQMKNYYGNEFLFNGIILAGVNDYYIYDFEIGKENGYVNSGEFSLLDLKNTDLVVLSSCESGKGIYNYFSSTQGLVEGIRQSGANNLIASLWKVDDFVTQELMVYFYDFYLGGTSISESLRFSKLKIKEKYKNPYFWAGFVHYSL